MEAYDPATVFSSIDANGRYAYGNQPRIALWNLTRLAEALLPVLRQEEGNDEAALASANEALATFSQTFENFQLAGFRRKLGLFSERDGDLGLIEDLLQRMAANRADFTLTFRKLCNAAASPESDKEVRSLFTDPEAYDLWAIGWRQRLKEESVAGADRAASMRKVNPAFIPRNHLVEAVIRAAVERQDFQPFEELLDVTSQPYDEKPGQERYALPASPEESVTQTFCGT
jgi:serine/tyrosine/threonine adenylyltransferase